MDEKELKKIIDKNPGSLLHQAYLLGRKDYALEMAPDVEKLLHKAYPTVSLKDCQLREKPVTTTPAPIVKGPY
jgi:hypothetical protein